MELGKKVSTIAMLGPLLAMPSGQGLNMILFEFPMISIEALEEAEESVARWQRAWSVATGRKGWWPGGASSVWGSQKDGFHRISPDFSGRFNMFQHVLTIYNL